MRIMVTGGAGYIGSVTARMLSGEGHTVLAVDNLSKGHRAALGGIDLAAVDIEDATAINTCCRDFAPEACMHFAARSLVGESMERPLDYFMSNFGGSILLARALVDSGCDLFVFSSTAAVYGSPEKTPILEDDPTEPINPYGLTKLMVERMLLELERAGLMKYASLRYFNAAGADVAGRLGEDHDPETHLIPCVIGAAAGRRPRAAIFGTDYPTPDGTCVRDYIHVLDLARAHVLALENLAGGGTGGIFNLGNGEGFSVREVIETVKDVSGAEFEVVEQARREGDPAVLVASADRIRSVLGWRPEYPGLRQIVESAWAWHESHPDGYPPD
ncbi:MAG: UDP-glucose 4-epimerase GalE [Candidatus Geothermincolia bacterium]